MKKKLFGVFLAAMLLLLPVGAASAATEGASNSMSESNVTITISTDKTEYAAGEEVHYTMTVENGRAYWNIGSIEFEYSNTEGLVAASADSMPTKLPQVKTGESYELTGVLVGDSTVFPITATAEPTEAPDSTQLADSDNHDEVDDDSKEAPEADVSTGTEASDGTSNTALIIIVCAAVVMLGGVVVVLLMKKGKNAGKKLMIFALVFGMTIPLLGPATAYAAEYETVTIRPYVKFMYGGQEVMIRAVLNLRMFQNRVTVKGSDQDTPKRITCHDPSIFKDFDGTYYIFGTHLAAGYTNDLRNWTSIDATYRSSFTQEVRDQIRAWNKDSSVGNWYDYLWAPDIIYNEAMDKYCMYLSANGDTWKSNIVLLTSDVVTGPYEYAGSIVYGGFDETNWTETDADEVLGGTELPERYITNGVKNEKWGDKFPNCIDPTVFYDDEGNLWMGYGSWSGGIFMLALDEATGLRDYSVTYETNLHSDAYFGTKIAGGAYVSGEGAYIEKIGDYYWLFVSYGNLEAAGGYNVRVYRSETPNGNYVDALGNDAYSDKYIFNYNLANKGVRLFGGYKWRTFVYADVAQGHNSAFVDEDGRAYIVYHTRTSNGSEGHTVKVLQLFTNKEGWIVAAPYQTSGEKLDASTCTVDQVAGQYEIILHELEIDYKNLESHKPKFATLNADGTVTGEYTGTWALEEGTSYITLVLNGVTYSGVSLKMNVENTKIETEVFTALGQENQLTIWGSKTIE